jgi:CO/xanthine dehydrogenase FAD-binding subunit
MIVEYHRPNEIDEAIRLLSRNFPPTFPLGGGNVISRKSGENFAVVDLQGLGLNQIQSEGMAIIIGATATLENLYEHPSIPDAVKEAIHLDATLNTRNTATLGGAIVAGTGGSALLAVMLAMDAHLEWIPGNSSQALGEFISLKDKIRPGKLIAVVQISTQAKVSLTSVGRSPLDPPFLIVAISRWPSGRTRLVLGGKVKAPILALDGTTPDGIIEAGINACSQLSNQWISNNYLKDITTKLIQRLSEA